MGRKSGRDLFVYPGKITLPKDAYKRVNTAITERGSSSPKLQKLLGVTDETFLNARKNEDGKTQTPTVVMMALELADDFGVDWLADLLSEPMYKAALMTGTLPENRQDAVLKYIEQQYAQALEAGEDGLMIINISQFVEQIDSVEDFMRKQDKPQTKKVSKKSVKKRRSIK